MKFAIHLAVNTVTKQVAAIALMTEHVEHVTSSLAMTAYFKLVTLQEEIG